MVSVEKFKQLRLNSGLTFRELSAQSGIPYSSITGMLRRKKGTLDILISLSKVFKVRIEDILEDSWEIESENHEPQMAVLKQENERLKNMVIELQSQLLNLKKEV